MLSEGGQYFVTRDAGEFKQTVACREYTLPRDDKASQPKGWIRGNMRIGPVLEITNSFQHFKYGIEIRIESVNQDNSHSCVRISYRTVKYVNHSIEDDTENLADSQEEEGVPTSSGVVAARSKAKAKPQPRESIGTTTIPLCERKWIDIEPSKQDLDSYDLSEESYQSSSTQSDVTARRRWSNSILQNQIPSTGLSSSNTKIGQMIDCQLVWLQAEDPNEDISIALIIWDQLFISVLFKDISGSNLIDPALQGQTC